MVLGVMYTSFTASKVGAGSFIVFLVAVDVKFHFFYLTTLVCNV